MGLGCNILCWSRANKLGLSWYTMLSLTETYILGLRGNKLLCLSKARWGEAKAKPWSLVIRVSRPGIEGG